MKRYTLRHITTYTYNDTVSSSYGRAFLTPRATLYQNVINHHITIAPKESDYSTGKDYFGNIDSFFYVNTDHTILVVDAASTVDITDPLADIDSYHPAQLSWEKHRPHTIDTPLDRLQQQFCFAYSDGIQSDIEEYTCQAFTSNKPMIHAIQDFMQQIYNDFKYHPGTTEISTPLNELLARKEGVCQDFTRLTVAGLHAMGLAAQYVSGYIATDPPPGKQKIYGADASHAWARVWLSDHKGSGRWVDFDPTNNQLLNDRYITIGWARDYADITPLKGVIYTDSTSSEISVSVDVSEIHPHEE